MTRHTQFAVRTAALGGLIIIGAGVRWYTATRNPQVHIPAVTLPNPNAYDLYVKAGEKLVRKDDIDRTSSKPNPDGMKPLTLTEREKLIADNAEILSLLRAGLKLPYLEPAQTDPNAPTPHWAKFRASARLLKAAGDVQNERGDTLSAMNTYVDGVAIGQQISRGGPLIARLVAIACQAIDRKPIWSALEKWDAATLKAGAKRMEAVTNSHVPFGETMTAEKYFGQRSMALGFQSDDEMAKTLRSLDSGNDDGMDLNDDSDPPISALERLRVQGLYMAWPKQKIYNNYTAYMDAMIAQSALPYAQVKAGPTLPADPINGILLPIFDKARFKNTASSETQNALLTITLALRAYQAEHGGAFPATLAELCPTYLNRLPDDPFALTVGTPFRYYRTAKGYVLYSIGPDGVDNHGEPIIDRTDPKNPRYFVETDSKGDILAGTNIY
jgi:hypothetical protein